MLFPFTKLIARLSIIYSIDILLKYNSFHFQRCFANTDNILNSASKQGNNISPKKCLKKTLELIFAVLLKFAHFILSKTHHLARMWLSEWQKS